MTSEEMASGETVSGKSASRETPFEEKANDSSLVPGTHGAKASWGTVLILGLGKSGRSVLRYCVDLLGSRVDSIFVAAGQPSDDAQAFLKSLACPGLTWEFGEDAFQGKQHFDLCIASPGIPFWDELYQQGLLRSSMLISEVEFAWRESDARSVWVAITGTNGKTTTTALCAYLLQEGGLKAQAVGNIGDVCLDAVAAGKTEVYVAEVSSYQLASAPGFHPDGAILLNITPDHIHWHRTFEAYRDAKFSLLDGLAAHGTTPAMGGGWPVAVLDATDDVVRSRVRALRPLTDSERGFRYIPVGTADGIQGDMRARCGAAAAAFLAESGELTVALGDAIHRVGRAEDLRIHGTHNISNALAAASIAVAMGVADETIAQGLRSFEPIAHRLEPAGVVEGVAFYNDSKATNVDATCKALESFPGKRLWVLLGGDDKGTDLAPLVAKVHGYAVGAICFGAAGPRFVEAFEAAASEEPEGFRLLSAAKMADALDVAWAEAAPGDVVLLSPACASFDEFTSYGQRGDVFKDLVAQRAGE